MSIVSEIIRIKDNVAKAYEEAEEKGAVLPDLCNSSNLPDTIAGIPQEAGSVWRPEPDWWDIDAILEKDTEDYPGKMIVLMTDGADDTKFTMNATNKIVKVRTSDGNEYTSTATHVWDRTKDKECLLGYKSRYYIVYFSETDVAMLISDISQIQNYNYSNLYMILKNVNLTESSLGNASLFSNHVLLESVKFINSKLFKNVGSSLFAGDSSLQFIDMNNIYVSNNLTYYFQNTLLSIFDDIKVSNIINLSNGFSSSNVRRINVDWDTSSCINFYNAFSSCQKLTTIFKIDFNSAENVVNTFYWCFNLRDIYNISNIKISGLSFTHCINLSHTTLLRIIDALCDYSDDIEITYTIVLGSSNLEKLTDEELAIGQNKGWTIS